MKCSGLQLLYMYGNKGCMHDMVTRVSFGGGICPPPPCENLTPTWELGRHQKFNTNPIRHPKTFLISSFAPPFTSFYKCRPGHGCDVKPARATAQLGLYVTAMSCLVCSLHCHTIANYCVIYFQLQSVQLI